MANQNPEIIDPVKFARQGESLSGEMDLLQFPRLNASLAKQLDDSNISLELNTEKSSGIIFFGLDFSLKRRAYVATGCFKTEVTMICQRCLEPVLVPLAENISLEFVTANNEGECAESSLEDSDYDIVMLACGTIKLQELIEDELLLALPFAPMHQAADCPAAQQIEELQSKDIQEQDRPNPFGVLADFAILKKDQES